MRNASSVSAHVSTWLIMMAWHRGCWRRSRAAWRPSKAREQCYSWSAASIRSWCAWASWRLSSLNEDVCQACKSATLSSPSSLTRLTTVTSYNCHVLQVLQVSRATSWEAVHSELLRGSTLWALERLYTLSHSLGETRPGRLMANTNTKTLEWSTQNEAASTWGMVASG